MLSNLLSMLGSLSCVVDGLVDAILDYSQASCRDAQASTHKSRIGNAQAFTCWTEHVLLGNTTVVEKDRSRVRSWHSQLVFLLLARVSLEFFLHDESGHAFT